MVFPESFHQVSEHIPFIRILVISLICISLFSGFALADPYFSPNEGKKPLKVQFSFPGGEAFSEILWSFGDKNTSSGVNPEYVYPETGMFYPTVTGVLPGAKISYTFDKIFVTPSAMTDSDSGDRIYPKTKDVNIGYEPLSEPERMKQAEGLNALGYPDYAARSYERLLAEYGMKAESLIGYAHTLVTLGRIDEALRAYDRSLSISDNATIWGEYGGLLSTAGRLNESVNAYNRSLSLNPDDPAVWKRYAEVLRALSRNKEADSAFNRSITSGSTNLTNNQTLF